MDEEEFLSKVAVDQNHGKPLQVVYDKISAPEFDKFEIEQDELIEKDE